MKILWCWRCKMEVPMLDEDEFKKAEELYSLGFKNAKQDRFKLLLDYYCEMTGFNEINQNTIMHHRVAQYGNACENCGKPYRTPSASFCAACGHEKLIITPADAR